MSKHGQQIARNASVVAVATLGSRILGFVRDLIVAFALGAGMFADAFFVAFRIPNLMRRLFGEGSLTMAFIPVYSRVREEEGEEAAQQMARSAMIWLGIILGALTVAVELAAGPVTLAIAPGFADDSELFATTVSLVRICFPYVIFICGVALCMGILNSHQRFLAPALAPAVLNVALIIAALISHYAGYNVAYGMAYGVLAGGAAQLLMQQGALSRIGFRRRGRWSLFDPGVRRMGLLMLPTVFGAAVYQLNILLGTLLASFLPTGSVSYLYYADRLVQFPLGVFGLAVSTAALPSLAALAAKGEMDDFGGALRSANGLTLFIALPAAAGLMALAEPVISVLFGHGKFGPEAVSSTASALIAYSAGLPFIALSRPLVSAFYALEDTKTPVKIAVLCLFVNIGLGAWLMVPLKHVGLAVAVSAASLVNALLLFIFLRRRVSVAPVEGAVMLKAVLLSTLIGAGAWYTGRFGAWSLAFIPVWAGVYFLGAHVTNMGEARMFADVYRSARRRLGRGRP
ncbi:murein biosynthesis integral membrane protein MurJ [Desulfovibrio oxyclinae]|uniref:murein biosynthesis integral membrane protein MurJ n=1 Tax=Desulfovibrio oxyclinae TaxID=63560 RepID=UPI000477F1E2|nr:murein biosynthesis integral membrane protein MurJ [Desulfovibrio oxyclinae]